jgi:uncharacterized protein YndB with AHSA1/START domain
VSNETLTVTATVNAPVETVFAVLADPTSHAAIDGTGWVRDALDADPLTEPGQVFRVAMYHEQHPNKHYEMANQVRDVQAPSVLSWEPGQYGEDGTLGLGGWTWRYDLAPAGDRNTEVTLTYDWSAVPAPVREHIQFPPFGPEHLDNSLKHLAELAAERAPAAG